MYESLRDDEKQDVQAHLGLVTTSNTEGLNSQYPERAASLDSSLDYREAALNAMALPFEYPGSPVCSASEARDSLGQVRELTQAEENELREAINSANASYDGVLAPCNNDMIATSSHNFRSASPPRRIFELARDSLSSDCGQVGGISWKKIGPIGVDPMSSQSTFYAFDGDGENVVKFINVGYTNGGDGQTLAVPLQDDYSNPDVSSYKKSTLGIRQSQGGNECPPENLLESEAMNEMLQQLHGNDNAHEATKPNSAIQVRYDTPGFSLDCSLPPPPPPDLNYQASAWPQFLHSLPPPEPPLLPPFNLSDECLKSMLRSRSPTPVPISLIANDDVDLGLDRAEEPEVYNVTSSLATQATEVLGSESRLVNCSLGQRDDEALDSIPPPPPYIESSHHDFSGGSEYWPLPLGGFIPAPTKKDLEAGFALPEPGSGHVLTDAAGTKWYAGWLDRVGRVALYLALVLCLVLLGGLSIMAVPEVMRRWF